jgi:acetolactate synthase-1/2/3 large subunit
MGYSLSASIGASIANDKKEVICIEGDGSIQMNLQELQTIVHHKLPIKIFILNNQGYSSIRQTQSNFFKGNLVGCGEGSGISFPSFSKLADLYDIKYFKIQHTDLMDNQLQRVLEYKDTVICEVVLGDYIFQPKLSSEKMPNGKMVSQPLENMFPFLSKEEL